MTPFVIGVAGGTGSGKTTVANAIVSRVGVERIAVLPHDAYYKDWEHLPKDVLDGKNFDHPDSLETDLLTAHVADLRAGRAVDIPVYDFKTHRRAPATRRVEAQKVILVEGILIFADADLRKQLDVKVFVDTDADVRLIRRIRRDIAERGRSLDSVVRQYEMTVRPMHLEFVEPSKRWADLIIPSGGENAVAMSFLFARLEQLLD